MLRKILTLLSCSDPSFGVELGGARKDIVVARDKEEQLIGVYQVC